MSATKPNLFCLNRIFSFMGTKKRSKLTLLLLLLNTYLAFNSFAQEIPLVYDEENTGASFSKPVLPAFSELPVVEPLTDPFMWSDGSGRSTNFSDWSHRRSEIKAEIEHYEIGERPERPDSITASYVASSDTTGTLTVNITENGQTLILTSPISLPSGDGPFPAIIGMNFGTGSLPADIFKSRKVATIAFIHNQVVTYGSKLKADPFYRLYPDLYYVGQYCSWAWGVSRLIDGLELVQDVLPIDIKHLAVTGCSYAGKMALFAGALDERIALTIVQESGGGGAAAWRVSETLGPVETLGSTNFTWFMSEMSQFAGKNVPKLPHDHHELMAMVAPRALFVIGNPSQVWLAEESGYVSCRAAKRVWDTFGISDRMGFSFVTDHGHCQLPDSEKPEVGAFVDKFLLGDTTANTNISTTTFKDVDYLRWTYWWGSGEAVFPLRDWLGTETVWLETECGTVGKNWTIANYPIASNKSLVSVKSGLDSTTIAPTDSASSIYFPFTVTKDTTYHIFVRLVCAKNRGDSFWAKLDDGSFQLYDGLVTTGLQWKKLFSAKLTPGKHTITLAYNVYYAAGAKLDKLCISSLKSFPSGEGETAANVCIPSPPNAINQMELSNGYSLGQNYPNPYNEKTNISFEVPNDTYVSLKVYNMLGVEMAELAGKEYPKGKHTLEFDSKYFSKGIYFYTLKADKFSFSRKMVMQ
jgi:hypothetical protein